MYGGQRDRKGSCWKPLTPTMAGRTHHPRAAMAWFLEQGKRTKKLRPPKVGVCGGLSGICDVRSSHTVRIRSGSLLLDPDSATLRSRPEACMRCFLGWPCNTNGAGFLRQPNCTGKQQSSDQTVKSKMLA